MCSHYTTATRGRGSPRVVSKSGTVISLSTVVGCSGRKLLGVETPRRQNSIESNDHQQVAPPSGSGLRKNLSFVRSGHSRMSSHRESKARRISQLVYYVPSMAGLWGGRHGPRPPSAL